MLNFANTFEFYKPTLKKDFDKPNIIERSFMNDNLKTKQYLQTIVDIVKELKIIYSDGFQIKDIFSTMSLTPKLISIAMNYNDVVNEYSKLSNTQITDLGKEFTNQSISTFWVNNNSEDAKYGINKISIVISDVIELVKISIQAAKDGIDLSDLQYLPSFATNIISLISSGASAFEEMKHLNAAKVSEIFAILLGTSLALIRK